MAESHAEGQVRSNIERLESEVDAGTLSGVLEVLAMVCYGKAEHLRSNWQDDATAKVWEAAGKKLDQVANSRVIARV